MFKFFSDKENCEIFKVFSDRENCEIFKVFSDRDSRQRNLSNVQGLFRQWFQTIKTVKNSKYFQTGIPDREIVKNSKSFQTGILDKENREMFKVFSDRDSRQGKIAKKTKSLETSPPKRLPKKNVVFGTLFFTFFPCLKSLSETTLNF